MNRKMTLFHEINMHLMEDENPAKYLRHIGQGTALKKYPFHFLGQMKETKQSPKYHPEGSVWNHTMLVVEQAAKVREKSSNPRVFMWSALLHDIGKPSTTRRRGGRITSYDHDKAGAVLVKEFLSNFGESPTFIKQVMTMVRWHMQIGFIAKEMTFADMKGMKEQADIKEISLLGWCDRMGRGHAEEAKVKAIIDTFIRKCENGEAET